MHDDQMVLRAGQVDSDRVLAVIDLAAVVDRENQRVAGSRGTFESHLDAAPD
jgi:hypothetical protein